MLNEEKIKLMTKLAAYERGKGKKQLPMSRYLKADYVGVNIINTLITSTIAFLLLLAIYVVYNLENIINNIDTFAPEEIGIKILVLYIIFIVVFAVIARVVYGYKFKKVREAIKDYYSGLRKLENIHAKESKALEEVETGGNESYDNSFND